MGQHYFLTGTDTDIGKTYAAVQLLTRWRQDGQRVSAMKPVASGCTRNAAGEWVNEDVERLIAATGQTDRAAMNLYRFAPAVSPHLAAQQAGEVIDLGRICTAFDALAAQADTVLVEGAGGWHTPLNDHQDIGDLAQQLGLPVVLVVGIRLGCINHALLTAQAIAAAGLPLAGWVANQLSPQPVAYADTLARLRRTLPAPLWLALPWTGETTV